MIDADCNAYFLALFTSFSPRIFIISLAALALTLARSHSSHLLNFHFSFDPFTRELMSVIENMRTSWTLQSYREVQFAVAMPSQDEKKQKKSKK